MTLALNKLKAHSTETIFAKEAPFETFYRGYGI